jgi:hypothetical protein
LRRKFPCALASEHSLVLIHCWFPFHG